MPRLALAAAVAGFACVALGAFCTHGLDGKLTAAEQGWFETATLYGLVHAASALFSAAKPAIGLSKQARGGLAQRNPP